MAEYREEERRSNKKRDVQKGKSILASWRPEKT
jgi:hypothetical protein